MPRGMLFVPIHWSACNASDGRVGALVNPAVDPLSGEPEFKHTPARIVPFNVEWHGFVLSRRPLASIDATWWVRVRGDSFLRYELAGRQARDDWRTWARGLLDVADPDADYLDCHDVETGIYRAAHVVDSRFAACLFVSPRSHLPARAWLTALFAKDRVGDAQAGRSIRRRTRGH
jgi:assimilatory nitrate reductase catalytic subunit